jgi:tetratricopeptide (TPR) repeat protein
VELAAVASGEIGRALRQVDLAAAEAAFRRAEELGRAVRDAPGASLETICRVLPRCGELAAFLQGVGKLDEAERFIGDLQRVLDPLLEREPEHAVLLEQLAPTRRMLSEIHFRRGQWGLALTEITAAVDVYRRLVRAHPAALEYRSGLAAVLTNQGNAAHRAGRTDEATGAFREAISLYTGLAGELPASLDLATGVIKAQSCFALHHVAVVDMGGRLSLDEARGVVAESLARLAELPESVRNGRVGHELAVDVLRAAADIERIEGRPEAAMTRYQEVLSHLRWLCAREPDLVYHRAGIAKVVSQLVELLCARGGWALARELLDEALALQAEIASSDSGGGDWSMRQRNLVQQAARVALALDPPEAARAAVERLLELEPGQWLVQQMAAVILLEAAGRDPSAGWLDFARECVRRAIDYQARVVQAAGHGATMGAIMAARSWRLAFDIERARGDVEAGLECLAAVVSSYAVTFAGRGNATDRQRLAGAYAEWLDELARVRADEVCAVAERMATTFAGHSDELFTAARHLIAAKCADRAIATLASAVAAGFADPGRVRADAAWLNVIERPDVRELLLRMEQRSR